MSSALPEATPERSRVYLIDASVYVFRAYFSLPQTMVNAAEQPINAVYGFAGFLADLRRQLGPDAPIAVAFDESLSTSFRNQIYPEYKANRPPAPEDLQRQFAWCQELCEVLRLPWAAHGEFEADDIIGSWATHARAAGHPVAVISRDKDLTQLVQSDDLWWDFASQLQLDPAGVEAKMGVRPDQVADLLALTGDSVDNIPGVKGVGPKAAVALLQHFGSLESVYANLPEVSSLPLRGAKSLQRKLDEGRDMADMSRRLTVIPDRCPGVPDPDWQARFTVPMDEVHSVCEQLGLGLRARERLGAFAELLL